MIKLFLLFMCFCPSAWAAYQSPSGYYYQQCSGINGLFALDGESDTYATLFSTNTIFSTCWFQAVGPALPAHGVHAHYFISPNHTGFATLGYRCVGSDYVLQSLQTGTTTNAIWDVPSGCDIDYMDFRVHNEVDTYYNIIAFDVLSSSGTPYSIAVDSTVIRSLLDDTTFQAIVTAPQSIADFLSFEGRSGGVHAFIWGGIYMMCFFTGFICGTRLV